MAAEISFKYLTYWAACLFLIEQRSMDAPWRAYSVRFSFILFVFSVFLPAQAGPLDAVLPKIFWSPEQENQLPKMLKNEFLSFSNLSSLETGRVPMENLQIECWSGMLVITRWSFKGIGRDSAKILEMVCH